MGYTTDFNGLFELNKLMSKKHAAYLKAFSETRRMKRNAEIVELMEDKLRKKVKLPVGVDGEYFVGGDGFKGQGEDKSILDYNKPPGLPEFTGDFTKRWNDEQVYKNKNVIQPGLWCQWTIGDEDGVPTDDVQSVRTICWDGNEKFYEYVNWLKYIIHHFLKPWGYKLNGSVEWRGEDWSDTGKIIVTDNEITIE